MTHLRIALLLALLTTPALSQKHTITPTDIANIKNVTTPVLSPDGHLIAYAVDTPVPAGKHRDAHIYLATVGDPASAHPFAYSRRRRRLPSLLPRRHPSRLPLQPPQPSLQRRALALPLHLHPHPPRHPRQPRL